MCTHWANTRRLLSNHNVAAVSALPDYVAVFAEHALFRYVVEQLAVALFMCLFNCSNTFEQLCNRIEAFFVCCLCEACVHVGPLVVLAVRSCLKVFCSRFDSAVQQFEPQLCMLFFVRSGFFKNIRNLFETVFTCLACKPVVLISCHRLACKCGLQVSFSL